MSTFRRDLTEDPTDELATTVSAQILDRGSDTAITNISALRRVHRRLAPVLARYEPIGQRVDPQSFLAVFPSDRSDAALDFAVDCASEVLEPDEPPTGAGLSIGISTGLIDFVALADGEQSFLGDAAVRATVLAGHAAAGAMFVDLVAYDFLKRRQNRLIGPAGHPVSYGKRRSISDTGYGDVIACHEVLWRSREYGLRRGKSPQRLRGRVQRWDPNGFGFVLGSDERFYYTDSRFLVGEEAPAPSQTVFFVPRPALQDGKNPVAAALVGDGDSLVGRVQSVHEDGELFVRVSDKRKNVLDLFQHADAAPYRLSRGDQVRFQVREGARGPVAGQLERIEPADGDRGPQPADQVEDVTRGGLTGGKLIAKPLGSITVSLPTNELTLAALELVRSSDEVALKYLSNDAAERARAYVSDGDVADDLAELLDKLICLAATFLNFEQRRWFEEITGLLVRIYAMPLKKNDVERFGHSTQISPHEVAPRVWLEVIQRVVALGGVAVRRGDWKAVKTLTLQLPESIASNGYDRNWLRHGLTMASRAGLFELDREKKSLLSFAQAASERLTCLQGDGLEHGDDDLLTSIAQFDVLSNIVALGDAQLWGSEAGRVYYPNFARFYSHRVLPIVERLFDDHKMREILFPLGDDRLAMTLSDIEKKASQEGWKYDGFMGWEGTRVAEFISDHLPASST